MTFRIHREGYGTLAAVGAVLLLVNIAAVLLQPGALVVTLPLMLLGMGFFAQFFRNPHRQPPACEGCILSPADGTIVAIENTHESEYFNDERLKVSIYMSALNVHLNRVPFAGSVVYQKAHPGKYLVAFHPKASELNEHTTVVFEDLHKRRVLVRQIAGFVARRIVCYMQPGQAVRAGDELGFIKFGSRCDVFLPSGCTIKAVLGQKVYGAQTILAVFPDSPPVNI